MGAPWTSPERIPNAPVREAYIASGKTPSEICQHLGLYDASRRRPHHPDTTGLSRMLGLQHSRSRATKDGAVCITRCSTISITNAKLICDALDVDFDSLYPDLPSADPEGGVCECGERMLYPAPRCGFCQAELEQFGEGQVAA